MVGYLVFLTTSIAIFTLFSLGLNLQWGFTGLINFGHVAFMTVGAYTTVILSTYGVPLVLAALIGATVAAILGLLIGMSTLRLRTDYLAIVTIGVSELIRLVVNNQDLPTGNGLTPGAFGLQSYPLPFANFTPNLFAKLAMIGLLTLITGLAFWRLWRWMAKKDTGAEEKSSLSPERKKFSIDAFRLIMGSLAAFLGLVLYVTGVMALYDYTRYREKAALMLLSVLILALVFWRLEFLVRSPWGRVLKAIREDEEVPRALGKNVFWYKLQSLMLGGAIAGLAGSLYAWLLSAVYPNNFEPQITFDAWIMVILGGAGNNMGAMVGTTIYWAYYSITLFVLPRIVPLDDARLGAFRIMVIGLILMVLMVWRPQGILGKKEELTLGR